MKGESWHGTMAYTGYTASQKEDHARERSNCELQPHHISYYDHIYSGESKQYSPAVMSYFEASCMRIKKYFPRVEQIYVQSNNVKCYKTPELVLDIIETVLRNWLELL